MDLFRTAVVLLLLVSFTGCTTMRAIPDVSATGIQQEVEPGDDVRVVMFDGRKFELEVTKVEAESLTGITPSGKRFKIQYASIRWLEVAEADTEGVAGSILTGLGMTYLAVIALAVIAFNEVD